MENQGLPRALVMGIAGLIFIVLFGSSMFVTIEPGEKGVLFKKFGGGLDKETVYDQGFQIIAPWNTMHIYDVRFKDTFVDTITTTEAINGALKRWTVKTSAYTAVAGDRLLADTATTAAFTITLPSSPSVGDEIHILDSAANFDSANLTVGRNGKKIQGLTADLTLTTENTGIGLVFMSDTYGWRVLVDAYAVDTTEL